MLVDEDRKDRPILTLMPSAQEAGDNRAARRRFDAVVAPHLSAMRARAEQLCRSYFDPDDLVQEALLRAFAASSQLNDPARMRPWLMRIVTNRFLDLLRKRRRQPHVIDIDIDIESVAPDPVEPPPWDSIEADDLRAAVDHLPDDVRETYRLFALEGRDYVAIAQIQGIPKATVGSRLLRARKRLRELLTAPAIEVTR